MKRKYIGERGATANHRGQRTNNDQHTSLQSQSYSLAEALEVFIHAKEAEGIRPRTIDEYRHHIKYLCAYLGKKPDEYNVNDLTPQIIRDYIIYLKDERLTYENIQDRKTKRRGLSVSTINIRLRTLRTMCRFWAKEGIMKINAMENIKLVKDDKGEEVPGLSDAEIDRILTYYDEKQFAEWRDKTLILLLLDTGLRIKEALALRIDQVDEKQLELWIPSSIAKNRKGRSVPVSREIMRRLIQLYEETNSYFDTDGFIFMNAYGEPFTPDAFRRRLNRMKNRVEIPRLHPHMFRHTFCRNYILNGGDIFTLQKIVDHADIKTTRKYIQMDTEHVRTQHNKFSPVRRLFKR